MADITKIWQEIKPADRPHNFRDAPRVKLLGRFLAALWNHSTCVGWQFYVARQRGGYRPEAGAGFLSVEWDNEKVNWWLDRQVALYEAKVKANPEYIRSDVPPPAAE